MKMKECPTCHAQCFEDMDTCYGCLHRFGEGVRSVEKDDPFEEVDVFNQDTVRQEKPKDSESKAAQGTSGDGAAFMSVPAIAVVPERNKSLSGAPMELSGPSQQGGDVVLCIRIPLSVGSVSAQYVEA